MPRLAVPAAPEPVLPKPVEAPPKLTEVPKAVEAPKLVELSRPVNPFRPVEPDAVELPKAPEPPPKLTEVPKQVEAPKLAELNRPAAPARPVEPSKPVELPKAPEPVEPLLALSPTPAPPNEPVKIPAGEARGRFAIGPDSNLADADIAAGSKDATSPPALGIANPKASATGNTTAGNASASPDSTGKPGSDSAKDKAGTGAGPSSVTANGAGEVAALERVMDPRQVGAPVRAEMRFLELPSSAATTTVRPAGEAVLHPRGQMAIQARPGRRTESASSRPDLRAGDSPAWACSPTNRSTRHTSI
jgi:hypothetical protein